MSRAREATPRRIASSAAEVWPPATSLTQRSPVWSRHRHRLLDEWHAPDTAASLNGEPFHVVTGAAESGLRGVSDEGLLAYADAHQRVMVTENVADFLPTGREEGSDAVPDTQRAFLGRIC